MMILTRMILTNSIPTMMILWMTMILIATTRNQFFKFPFLLLCSNSNNHAFRSSSTRTSSNFQSLLNRV